MVWAARAPQSSPGALARMWAITSESVVVAKGHSHWSTASRRSSAALMTLPLWPRASCPWRPETRMGWAFSLVLEPVVE